jgi:hypothetical protein
MLTREQCGRCDQADLLRIPTSPSDHSHIVVGERLMHDIKIVRYVCTNCGHVEEWVDDLADLHKLKTERLDGPEDAEESFLGARKG